MKKKNEMKIDIVNEARLGLCSPLFHLASVIVFYILNLSQNLPKIMFKICLE